VLGNAGFAESVRQQARGNPREQKLLHAPTRATSWEQIVAALERTKGQSWNQFAERHGGLGGMRRSGSGGPLGGCVLLNWAGWFATWIMRWSAKRSPGSSGACNQTQNCVSNWCHMTSDTIRPRCRLQKTLTLCECAPLIPF
jgi:hypothetical protein